jgi:small-conductance mechanosensitive channel
MPDPEAATQALTDWLSSNAFALLVVFALAFIAYRGARPFVHRFLTRAMSAQQGAMGDGPAHEVEVERRAETIEDLFTKVLRFGMVLGVIAIVLGIFDLWSLLAGFSLLLAAIAFAGQSIILDYIMGVLILLEGQYFKGDFVAVNAVEGTVEEVGFRRTVIRDVRGTLHSVSNGLIRQSSNFTRTYAQATIDIDGVADRDVEAVIELLNAVGRAIAADETLAPLLQDVPGYLSTVRFSSSGTTLRLGGKVRPESRARIEAEMRRRVAAELAARGITLIRPTVPDAPRP